MSNDKKPYNYILCILSGIVTAVGFKFPECNFLVWFSLIPCFYVLFNLDIGQVRLSFFVMFLYGITFYGILFTFIWGIYPLDWLGFNDIQSFFIILSAWIGLSVFEALFPALLGAIWCKLNEFIKIDWLTIVLLWIVMEWLQGLGLTGFTWGRLANSQYNNQYIIQSASILGSLFVSAIIVLANALIAVYLHNKDNYKYIICFFTVFAVNFGYGYYRINNTKIPENTIQASVIQANINTAEKWDNNYLLDTLDIYTQLTKIAHNNAKDGLDLVIWAETSLPITLLDNKDILESCHTLADFIESTMFIGAFEDVGDSSYNTIFNISPQDKNISTYHKQNLVPFGEYLPFRNVLEKIFPSIKNINAVNSDISFGKNDSLIVTPKATVANLICFDSIFPDIARKQVMEGANIITIETNDSWFNGTAGIHQHLSQSVIRAVENNRYVLRSANTGISAVISSTGEILSALEPETLGYINYSVPLIDNKTLYTELGDIIVFISIFLLISVGFIRTLFEYILSPIIKKINFFIHMLKR